MTKVDEHAVVPPVDEAGRAALTRALGRPPVVAARVIGSQAKGTASPLSDVDVAVWLAPGLPPEQLFEARLLLADAAARALRTGEVDVVVLNDAPALLQHRAIRDGRLVVEVDRDQRVRFETAAVLDYLDTGALRRTLSTGIDRRLAEDRFGRR